MTTPRAATIRALGGYCITATGVRIVDAGMGVGLLLLAERRFADPAVAARTGGLLVALWTVPHLLGPLLARRLDVAHDYRRLLGLAYALVAVLLGTTIFALGRLPTALVAVLVLLAGLGGPMLTGGLSSRLADLVPSEDLAQRRAQGLDATIYGIAGTAGPAVVAALSGWSSPTVAMLTLCGLAVVSAAVVQTLPAAPARDTEVPRVRDVLPLVLLDPPLRRVNYATMVTAAAQAGLTVIVVQFAGPYGIQPSTTALLLAVMGAGNLLASLALSAKPLAGDPDRLTTRHVAVVAGCFGLCAVAPSFTWAVAAFGLMGIATAPFVTATFAARNTYAPPDARAQVFITLAALKISAASGGTALVGLLVALGPRTLLLTSGAAVLLTAVATLIDRRASASRPRRNRVRRPAR